MKVLWRILLGVGLAGCHEPAQQRQPIVMITKPVGGMAQETPPSPAERKAYISGVSKAFPAELLRTDGPKGYLARLVEYGDGVTDENEPRRLQGLYVRPDGDLPPGPAILAIHGRSGLHLKLFEELALPYVASGYRFFAIDRYGRVPTSLEEGTELESLQDSRGYTDAISNVTQASSFLANHLDAGKTVIMGWDSGGKWAVTIPVKVAQPRFAAIINFYGDPSALSDGRDLLFSPVFMLFTVNDPLIPSQLISNVQARLRGKTLVVKTYQGVPHGFMESIYPKEFRANEAKRAAEEVLGFIKPHVE